MALDVENVLQLVSFARGGSDKQQMSMFASLVKQFAPQYTSMNEQQAEILAKLLSDDSALNEHGVPNDEAIRRAFAQFRDASTSQPPVRIICQKCGNIRKVDKL